MPDPGPSLSEKVRRDQAEKEKRLAEALRANLHRRKSQVRARAEPAEKNDETIEK